MRVDTLQVEQFRNIHSAEVSFSPAVNIFTGRNGSGKTNLLEAIATLSLGRTQRLNATDQSLIQHNHEHYRLSGRISQDSASCDVAVAYQQGRGKKITIDEQPVSAAEMFRRFSAVSLAPEDSEIISGPPGARRRFLDFHLAQASVSHLDDLSQYQRILAQRNSHLKQYGLDQDGSPFDEQLIEFGSRITAFRAEFLTAAESLAGETYSHISDGGSMTVSYLPSAVISTSETKSGALGDVDITDTEAVAEKFRRRLRARQAAEAAREITLVGPHRDNFEIFIRSLPARTHASQGEWRSAAVALKLAVFHFLREKKKNTSAPLLLLDEVFAELDQRRQEALMKSFSDYGQLFVTTALDVPPELAVNATVFEIENGAIKQS